MVFPLMFSRSFFSAIFPVEISKLPEEVFTSAVKETSASRLCISSFLPEEILSMKNSFSALREKGMVVYENGEPINQKMIEIKSKNNIKHLHRNLVF